MANYKRVLIPMDLSLGNGLLTPAVRRMIDVQDAEITLLHVVESEPWTGRNGQMMRLMSELELFAHRQFRGARISRRIEWGRVADCILRAISGTGADVVLISSGQSSLGKSALGPVATEVLADAPCPVLIEWAVSAPVNRARVQPVCCAIGFDGGEEEVLREAVSAAARMEAPMKVVAPLSPAGLHSAILWDVAERGRAMGQLQLRVEELCRRFAPGAEVEVGVGTPESVVSRALRFHGAALLVTGGGTEAPLAAESECPVLYVGGARQRRAENPDVARSAMGARRSA